MKGVTTKLGYRNIHLWGIVDGHILHLLMPPSTLLLHLTVVGFIEVHIQQIINLATAATKIPVAFSLPSTGHIIVQGNMCFIALIPSVL